MIEYLWAFYALASALFTAGLLLVSEYYKQSNLGFLTVIRFVTILILLPFVFFVEWPKEPLFYAYVAIAFVLFPVADVFLFRATAQYGAGILSRFLPLTAVILFVIWLIFDNSTWQNYLAYPLQAIGIVGCLLAVVFCMSFLRFCEMSTAAFKVVLPALMIIPLGQVFIKLSFEQTELLSGALISLFAGSFVGLITNVVIYMVVPSVRHDVVVNKLTIKAGIICSIFSTLLIYTANLSFDLVPNPAYATAVSFTST